MTLIKKIHFFLALVVVSSFSLMAQMPSEMVNAQINISFVSGDIFFAEEAIKTVEIKAEEADTYILVEEKLKLITENPKVLAISRDSIITLSVEFGVLKNIQLLLERAKFPGRDAIKFKRLVSSIKKAEEYLIVEYEKQKNSAKTPPEEKKKK